MAGYEQLLAGKGINIADAQQQGLTIGALANANAKSGIELDILRNQLAMQQDPRYADYIGGLAQMLQGGDAGQGFGSTVRDLFTRYPMQGANAITQMMGLAKSGADIAKTRAEADKDATSAKVQRLQVLANAADGLANSQGPLMPDKVMTFLRQASYVGAQPLLGDVAAAVQSGDEGAIRGALKNFAQAGSTMAQRATANSENVKAGLAPQEFALKAYEAAKQAAQWVGGGEIKQNAQGGFDIIRPNAGAPMPPLPPGVQQALGQYGVRIVDPQPAPGPAAPQYTVAPSITNPQDLAAVAADAAKSGYTPASAPQGISAPPAPVAPASGPNPLPTVQPTGVQAALNPAQAALKDSVMKPQLEEAAKNTVVAQRVLQIIPPLRAEIAQGFTGPLTNSEAGRNLLGVLTQIGAITPEQAQKYGAMRASDALSAELLGQISHQLNPRGSNMVLQMAQRAKTGPVDPQEVAMTLLNALATDARNTVSYGTALSDYVTKNPTDYGLSGWKPPAPRNAPPAGKFAQQLPPASVANMGKIATDVDTGARYRSNGREWVEVK